MTVVTETPPPHAVNPEAEIQVAILDVSQARLENARDMADARLTAETDPATANGGRLRNIVRKIWKGNIANDYYRQKYTHEALDQIDQTGDIYANEDHTKSRDAVGAVVNRFTDMYSSDLIHDGETRQELAADPENSIQKAVKNLVGAYARDELNENSFEEEKNRVLRELAKQNPDVFKKGMAFADNLLTVAQNVKAQVAHGKGVDEIMDRAKFVVGEARMGVRSEANFNRIDKVVEKIHKTKLGSLVNESTIAAAASVVSSITKMGSRREVGQALALTGVMGVAGAAIAGARESKKFKQERNQHMRESAMGQVFKAEAKRREQLEQSRYETKGARDLTAGLNELFDEEGKRKPIESPDAYRSSIEKLVEARMRTKMSDTQNIDLIHFSSAETVEQERFDLDLAMAKAKVALRKEHEKRGKEILPDDLKSLTFDQVLAVYDTAFSEGQTSEIANRNKVFEKMRRKEVAKAAAKGLIIGAAVGFGVQELASLVPIDLFGLGAHPSSVIAPGRENSTTLLHGLVHGNEAGSRGLSTHISSHVVEAPKGGIMHDITLSPKAHVSLPEGYSATQNGANHWDIKTPEGVKLSGVDLNPDGTISAKSLDYLSTKGVGLGETGLSAEALAQTSVTKIGNDSYVLPKGYSLKVVTGPPGAETNHWQVIGPDGKAQADFHIDFDGSINAQGLEELKSSGLKFDITGHSDMIQGQGPSTTMNANELIWNNADQTDRVHRVLWYGNNTPGVYDQNELRTHAGGVNGTWFDEKGNVVIDVSRMNPDGSFQGGQSANPFELTGDNKLALAVSLSKESQDTIFKYDFITTPDGRTQAIIPPNSPIYQLFKTDPNGDRVFNGRYFEVMEMTGQQDQYGQQVKVLGTFVGHSQTDNLVGNITQPIPIETHVNTLAPRTQVLDFSGFKYVETTTTKSSLVAPGNVVPMVPIPLRARRGLEVGETPEVIPQATVPETRISGDYGYYGTKLDADRRWLREHPEAHKPRTRVENADGTVTWVEADGSPVVRDVARERAGLETYLNNQEARNNGYKAYLKDLENTGSVQPMNKDCRVVVNIPAWMEEKNLYNLLEQYTDQRDADGNKIDPSLFEINVIVNRKTGSASDTSVEEINRFIGFYAANNDGKEPNINYIDVEFDPPYNNVGHARKIITDLTLMRSLERGEQSAPLYIETEDADLMHVDPKTVINVINKMDEQPHLDAVTGVHDRMPSIMKDNDYLFLRRRTTDFTELLARKYKDPNDPNWHWIFNRNFTTGWNVAYSAEAYALIDGYESLATSGEDILIGQRASIARGDGELPNQDVIGRVYSRTDSSPRRFILEAVTGRPSYQDGNFEDEEINRNIRESSLDDLIGMIDDKARINETNTAAFKKFFSGYYSFIKTLTPDTNEAQALYRRLAFFLGMDKDDYEFSPDGKKLTVKSLDNVAAALENYRQRYADRSPRRAG